MNTLEGVLTAMAYVRSASRRFGFLSEWMVVIRACLRKMLLEGVLTAVTYMRSASQRFGFLSEWGWRRNSRMPQGKGSWARNENGYQSHASESACIR
ncbi:hypothetical protein CEXT_504181 [Caerostris extrusa]|uniref:Uncharacterized protein n=1 Tax=Caerostris extrusa TaxID=172846 RepID=A0AAV4P0E9_CAEEX|nr:hypothetical protein CEXT_504181 [Caerostris extrusa]